MAQASCQPRKAAVGVTMASGSGAAIAGLRGLCFQISTSQIKVDKVQIIGSNCCPFAVCLDQDERKILQSVVR